MEARSLEIRCEITPIENGLVEFSFGEGARKAVLYSRQKSTTLVCEEHGKIKTSKSSGAIHDLAVALAQWVTNEQVHGTHPKVPTR